MFSGPIYRFIALIWLTLPASTLLAKEVTILYTNDIESVYEPVEASWRDDMQRMGGMARLATLLDQERGRNPATFTVDAGDIFTAAGASDPSAVGGLQSAAAALTSAAADAKLLQ
ncbi:MAG: hypothetical protein EBZ18_06085, partial [Alphaproteobacteria bacterium]|nr:hypothetical protein [Alphaproteobacteria bacterium]